MGKDPVEREVKLAADLQFALPDLRMLVKRVVRVPEQRLLSTYFDTPDYRLWHRGIALRHRTGEGSRLWTLKLPKPSSGPTIDRIELEWGGPVEVIPMEAQNIVQGIVRRVPLRRVTSLHTDRRRLMLQGGKNRLVAELDDDTVTIHGGPHDGVRFRQVEVELAEGHDHLLKACIEQLVEAGAWVDRRPKLAYAIDIRGDGGGLQLGPKSTTRDAVRASLGNGLNRILSHEYLLRLGPDPSAEAIHQTRVAARRLRSDLNTFKALLDPLWVAHARSDLKWVGDALGLVRDADVLREHLGQPGSSTTEEPNGASSLHHGLREQRLEGTETLTRVLESERYLVLLDKLNAAAEWPPFFSSRRQSRHDLVNGRASKTLPKTVERPLRKMNKEAQRAGEKPTNRQLHKIRVRAKQIRYAAEVATPVIGKPAIHLARAAESLQTVLGEHHDAVVAEEWLRKRARGASWKVAFTAGELASEQNRRQQHFRKGWRAHLKKVDRSAQRWPG